MRLSLIAALYMFVRYCSAFLPMFLRCMMLMGPVELLFLLFLIAARTCSVVMLSVLVVVFPSHFPVCGVGLVRNSVGELFVEGTGICFLPVW